MAIVSLILNEQEEKIFKSYSERIGKSLSELFKSALLEQIEDKYDYEKGLEALNRYKK